MKFEKTLEGFAKDCISEGNEEIYLPKEVLIYIYKIAKKSNIVNDIRVADDGDFFVEVFDMYPIQGGYIDFNVMFDENGIAHIGADIHMNGKTILVIEEEP